MTMTPILKHFMTQRHGVFFFEFRCVVVHSRDCFEWYRNRKQTPLSWNMFYLTTHSTHFIYGYMASDIWLRTTLIARKETRCRHIGYSFRLTARVLLYAQSHRQDITYHGLCYTSRGAIAQWVHPMKDRSDDASHHERTLLPRGYLSLQNVYILDMKTNFYQYIFVLFLGCVRLV